MDGVAATSGSGRRRLPPLIQYRKMYVLSLRARRKVFTSSYARAVVLSSVGKYEVSESRPGTLFVFCDALQLGFFFALLARRHDTQTTIAVTVASVKYSLRRPVTFG